MRRALARTALLLLLLGAAWFAGSALMDRVRSSIEARYHVAEIREASRRSGIDPVFLASMVYVESRYNPRAVSPSGAIGLMQLMPATARQVARQKGIPLRDTEALFEPRTNILLGSLYFRTLQDQFQDTDLAVAAYNGGPAAVREWLRSDEGVDSDTARFAKEETRRYVQSVARIHGRLRRAKATWDWIRDLLD